MSEDATEAMFGDDDLGTTDLIKMMAEAITIEMDAVEKLHKEHARRKVELDSAKERLCVTLQEAGMESCKLDNGLTPRAVIKEKFFKASEVSDEILHDWLRKAGIGDIIIPYVHWGTMNSTVKAFRDGGGEIPASVLSLTLVPTITMNGKSKFLAERAGA